MQLWGEEMKSQHWKKYTIKDSEKGPMVWEAKGCDPAGAHLSGVSQLN